VISKLSLEPLASRGMALLKQFVYPVESADYQAWRHKFLYDRLRLCLFIAFPCFLTFVASNIYTLVLQPQQFNDDITKFFGDPTLADQIRDQIFISDGITGVLLFACLILQKTSWGKQYPTILFLNFCWSITLVPQLVGTFLSLPNSDISGWLLVFLAQATLIPVHWQLHLLAQLVPLGYYAIVNPILGLTAIQGRSIYNPSTFLFLFWLCLIFDLGVYLYERLQRAEFESRRELRIFLHAVSHDLKTPVMGTSLVLQNLLKNSDEQIMVNRSVIERLLQGSDRQLTLINSLLEAHTTELRGISLHCEPLQLSTIVDSVLSDLKPVLVQNRITTTNQVSQQLPTIYADAHQIWRVLGNLMTNAMKHNPNGIDLVIDAEVVDQQPDDDIIIQQRHRLDQTSCHQSLQSKSQWILCRVQDNGVGIDSKQQQRLFDLYTRGSRARYMPGLGLGLYLCKQIINAHGGRMGVNSRMGEGSTFWFTLPTSQQAVIET
jgi:signal transduction histidine kinase